jgi:hypothetical protein
MSVIPPEVADILRPLLPELAAETIREIGAEVPAYSRPLEGDLGVMLRYGTERALRRFVDSIENPGQDVSDRDRRIYIELGRLEMRQGRTLNALLAAYRVGAQVAWRRFVEAGERAQLEPATLYQLGEAIFAHIDAISGESIEGYAAEQSAAAGERQRRRARLVALLALDPPPAPEVLRSAATRAAWTPPARIAALIVDGAEADSMASRLGPGAVAAVLDGAEDPDASPGDQARPAGHMLAFVPDPDAPGRRAQLELAVGSHPAALGPTVAVGEAGRSAERARRALELRASGALPGEGLIVATEHATALLLHADPRLATEFAAAALAPLQTLRPAARARLTLTLATWLDRQGRTDETAHELGIHPQTVRYRLGQLREAFGMALDDVDARFELALALRVAGVANRA